MLLSEMSEYLNDSVVIITKEDDGYKIVGVSTAAIRDNEGETFTIKAMDYDTSKAIELDDYPEFRMFHKQYLAVGKVTKMSRVGIFAIDEGYAYDDPFSKEVCEKILSDNNGRWRMSRGFYVVEATGGCPKCGEGLLIETKHMVTGFSCPSCSAVHLGYKGTLKNIEFLKTRTFDVTITDIPCVPMTGVSAFKNTEEVLPMTKKELREKLLDAGLSPDVVDERLKEVDDERLKELDTLPQAKLLKELDIKEQGSTNEELFVLDPEVLKDFANVVKDIVAPLVSEAVNEALSDIDIDLGDIEIKEFEGLDELKEQVAELKETVDVLAQSDDERLQEMLKDAPRAGKLRISRSKCNTKKKTPEDEEEEEEDEPEEKEFDISEGIVFGSDGEVAASMTEFISAGGE